MWKELTVRLTGDPSCPGLLMHNGLLADPRSDHAKRIKKISGKRLKTEADHEEMGRLEWVGSLYWSDDGPVIPSTNVEGMLLEAAKKVKKGKKISSGVYCSKDSRIDYDGPRTVEELWADEKFRLTMGVRVQRNRVIRTRPLFPEWSAQVTITYEDSILDRDEMLEIFRIGGSQVGLLEWRPKFGRFTVEEISS